MDNSKSSSAERVREALLASGAKCQILTLPDSTHSAADAARAVNCCVEQIVKSIVFRAPQTDRPILVLAAGNHRVDEERVAGLIGEPIEKADAEFIRRRTGFAIGGVSPVGHIEPVLTLIDEDLWRHDAVWAAAGTPNAVFQSSADELQRLTGAQRGCIKRSE